MAYLCARSFLREANPALLLLGSGIFVWGIACYIASVAITGGSNFTVTIHNLGVWLFGVCSLAGSAVANFARWRVSRPRMGLVAAGGGCAVALAGIVLPSCLGWLPVFFIQGQGGTPLRQVVLGSSIGLFVATAILMSRLERRHPSAFFRWYAPGAALLALGLTGALLESVHGGLLGWTGRAAQYLGGAYLLAAGLATVRESKGWRFSLVAALRASEERYKVLFETSRDAIMTLEPSSWRFTTGNPACVALFGAKDEQEFIEKNPWELSPEFQPDGRPSPERAREKIESAMREGSVFFDWTHRRFNGETFPSTVLLTRLDLNGRSLLQATVRDISEQKRTEEALLTSKEAKFSAIFHGSADGILLADPETRRLGLANDAICRMLGYSAEEFREMRVDDIPPKESLAIVLSQFESYRRDGHSPIPDLPMKRKDGSVFFASLTATEITVDGKRFLAGFFRDVTAHKRAQDALAADAIRRRILVDQSRDGIVIIDQDGKVYEANRRFAAMLGYSAEEVATLSVWDWDYLWSREQLTEMIRTVDESGNHFETRHRRKDGTVFDVAISTNAAVLDGQKLVFCICRDISQRKRAEQRLEKLNLCLLSFGSVPEENINRLVAFLGDQLGATCALYNRLRDRRLYAMGCWHAPADFAREDQAEGHICYDVIQTGDAHPAVIRDLQRSNYARTDPNVLRYGLKTYVGQAVSLEGRFIGSLCVVRQEDWVPGQDELHLLGIVASAIGVEEKRLQAEYTLRASEERHRSVLHAAMDGYSRADLNGRLLEVNRAYCQMSGYSEVELTGMSVAELEVDETAEETAAHFRTIIERGEDRFKTRHRRKDGSVFAVEVSTQYKPTEGGQIVAFLRDLTREQELEQQVLHSQKMEAVGRLAGGVAHDFNNLLQSILGYCELLLPRFSQSPEDNEDLLEIQKAAQRAADLTGQLLAFSRKQIISPSVVNLNEIVESTQKMLRRIIGEDIHITLNLATCLPAVKIDVGQIQQVVMNLAVNARDAMPRGGRLGIDTDCVTLDADQAGAMPDARPGTFVCLTVSDSGMGMSAKLMARIFGPFFTTKGLGKGTGLGLSVIYGIVCQHEGWVNVTSEEGKGTSFKVYLPAVERAVSNDAASDAPPPSGSRGERILLVEDEPAVRNLAVRILENAGYDVTPVTNAKEGESVFAQEDGRFDLIFSDMVLPDQNGVTMVERFLCDNPGLAVLFCTGSPGEHIWRESGEQRYHRYLLKPYVKSDLLRAVREILDAREHVGTEK